MKKNKKHLCNNYFNNKLKEFFNSTKSIYIIIVCALVFGFLLEILIGTNFFETNNYSKTIMYKDLDVSYKKNSVIVETNDINKFINNIELNLDFDNRAEELECKLYYYDKKGKKHFIQNNNLGKIDFFNPIIEVRHNVKKIELVFNYNSKNIKIKNIKISGKYEFNIIRFLAIVISLYLILDLIRYIYLDKKPKLYLYFLKISLIVGSFYAISTPFYYSWDEKEHMVRAYNVSRFNFIQLPGETVKWSVGLNEFVDYPSEISVPTTYEGFKNKVDSISKRDKTKKIYVAHNSTAITYLFPTYVVSGSGMFIARLLGLSFVFQFYFGRFLNMILGSVLLCLAVKYSGKYNKIFFMFGLIPFMLFQNASFSPDAITNSCAVLSVALTLYYKEEKKKIDYKDWVILLICYIMTFSSKIAYFPIGFLILMIPTKKFKNKKISYFIKFITIFICFILFGIGTVYANKMGIVQWTHTNANTSLQLKNIITKPFMFPYVVCNTISKNILTMFSMILQFGYCGNFDSLVLILLFIEFIVVIANSGAKTNNKLFDKVVLFGYVILSICSSMGALYLSYTPVGSDVVAGYQGRYIVPVLVPFLLLFVSKKFKLEISENKIIYFILVISVILYIISFFSYYINNFYS